MRCDGNRRADPPSLIPYSGRRGAAPLWMIAWSNVFGFVDWTVLWLLWHVLFLGSYGLPAARAAES